MDSLGEDHGEGMGRMPVLAKHAMSKNFPQLATFRYVLGRLFCVMCVDALAFSPEKFDPEKQRSSCRSIEPDLVASGRVPCRWRSRRSVRARLPSLLPLNSLLLPRAGFSRADLSATQMTSPQPPPGGASATALSALSTATLFRRLLWQGSVPVQVRISPQDIVSGGGQSSDVDCYFVSLNCHVVGSRTR